MSGTTIQDFGRIQQRDEGEKLRLHMLFIAFLAKLKKLGYTKAWVGPVDSSPFGKWLGSDMVVVEPRLEAPSCSPPLWNTEFAGLKMGCGNGRDNCTQAQMRGIEKFPPGVYDLTQPIEDLVRWTK